MTSVEQQCSKRQDHDACSHAMLQAGIGAERTKSNLQYYKCSSSIFRLLQYKYGMQLALPSFL